MTHRQDLAVSGRRNKKTEASIRAFMGNLEKARAVSPFLRPWRSNNEASLLRRIVFQWEHFQVKNGRLDFRGRPRKGLGKPHFPRISGRELARRLGVACTTVQRLQREFRRDPAQLQADVLRYGLATFGQFEQAREETLRMRSAGALRRRIRFCKGRFDGRKAGRLGKWANPEYERYTARIRAMHERTWQANGPALEDSQPESPRRQWDDQRHSWRVDVQPGNRFLDVLTGASSR